MSNMIPVILSGGSGTRLWPMSRKHYPKQLLDIAGTGKTLLQETALRFSAYADPIIVCSDAHRFIVAEQLEQVGVSPAAILLEPCGRNTAPAIALAAHFAKKLDKSAYIGVFPADHFINDNKKLIESIELGRTTLNEDKLVTFGIYPDKPETGYGYIKVGEPHRTLQNVEEFVEKPDLEIAKKYITSGKYLWNSGMFLFSADYFLKSLILYEPDIARLTEEALKKAVIDLDFIRVDQASFEQCKSISVDYALMEKSDSVLAIALDVGWSDIGNWQSLWEVSRKDAENNVTIGDVFSQKSTNCYVSSGEKFTAIVGVKDLIVVDTDDALLVTHKDFAQEVKYIPALLSQENRHEHLHHRNVHRPWGAFDSIHSGERYQVKKLVVKPGASLSLQLHHHRAEHWVVVEGTALVTLDGNEQLLTENESIYIPVGATHRLTNPGKIPLQVIEVQSGSYLGEDDIIRIDDNYQRNQ